MDLIPEPEAAQEQLAQGAELALPTPLVLIWVGVEAIGKAVTQASQKQLARVAEALLPISQLLVRAEAGRFYLGNSS